jgi:hypothetical protein
MTLKEAYEKQRLERLSLQKTVARLEKTIESLKDGTYIDEEKAKHLRLINRLTQENQHLTNLVEKYKGYFHDQMGINSSIKYEGLDLISKYEDLKREYEELLAEYKLIKARLNAIYSGQDNTIKDLMTKINSLKDSLAKEQAKLNTDGTNSSLPTSQTPIGKTKVIPNSRKKTGRKKGGQPGHRKSVLEPLSSDEITDHVYHELSECTYCGGGLSLIDQCEKDEIDLEIRIVKRRHIFYVYQCDDCGRQIHSPIPLRLKEPVQYGSNLQALSLALINQGFVSINRTRHILSGLSGGELHPCDAYICKLQKRASSSLQSFVNEVRLQCIRSELLYWDDTVIFVNTKRACMRFYGNDNVALFKAHEKKNRASIDEDAILAALSPETTVMHDHVLLNYNDDFRFQNVECSQHLERELQKIADFTLHDWASRLKELIAKTIHDRHLLTESGHNSFEKEYTDAFNKQLNSILSDADEQHKESAGRYYESDERKLINRIKKFRNNHFRWVYDFSIPITNNLSERNLRHTKVKQKVSGQYLSIDNAKYFADIRTYLQTCRLHGITEFDAFTRLTRGSPYTLKEVLGEA